MRTIFLDFETYFDDEYSLRKMTPVEYVLDPRFECNGCAIKDGIDGEPYWLDGDQLQEFFNSLPKEVMLVTHNALFDMCIVAWRYNFIPKLMADTMGIARAMLGHCLKSVSLAAVSQHLELGAKGTTLLKVKGMNLAVIKAAGLYDEYVSYGLDDVEKCAGIFDKLVRSGQFPMNELVVMDMVLRCAIEPRFQLCRNTLAEHLHKVQQEKATLLDRVGVSRDELMSNERFAELLRSHGVEPPTKISPTTGKTTYAFAKTDPGFIELEEHENPMVQALIAARVGHKTTLEESRCQRLLNISNLVWPETHVTREGNQPGWMPIPLRFSGAHTHRLSGDWKLNLQNLPRGGQLRRALTAPPGYTVLTVDASQIEARIVAWICGQLDLVEQFANGEDVYSVFASDVFGYPVDKKAHPVERFIGKTSILGLGYGVGWPKFQGTVKVQSRLQLGQTIEMDDGEAARVVGLYRSKYAHIPKTWTTLNMAGIPALASGRGFVFGPCQFEKEAILLPSGLRLHYHGLEYTEGEWRFTHGGKPKRLYGAALLENITQALARIHVMDAALRVRQRVGRHGLALQLQVHDELVYVVPDEAVDVVKAIVLEEMERRPAWAPELPLAAEAGVGPSYGDAK